MSRTKSLKDLYHLILLVGSLLFARYNIHGVDTYAVITIAVPHIIYFVTGIVLKY